MIQIPTYYFDVHYFTKLHFKQVYEASIYMRF